MRSKVLAEARSWPVAWQSFVELSGGRLGFDRVESDRVLKARFRSLYVRTALMSVRARRDGIVVSLLAAVTFCCCIAVLVATVTANVGAAVVAAVTTIAVLFAGHRLLPVLLRAAGGRWSAILACSAAAAGSVGAATWLARHWLGYDQPFSGAVGISDYRAAFDAGVVIGLLGLPISMVLVLVASLVGCGAIGRSRMRRQPDVVLFGAMVEILGYLGGGPAALTSLVARRRTAQSFERAARAVEYGLRHALRLSDSRNDLALRKRLHAIAATIRAHQVSFVLSEKAALVELSNLCVRTVRSVCSGALGSLPVASSPSVPPPGAWRQASAVVRDTAVVLVPLAVVAALMWRGVLSDGALGRAVVVGTVSWAVLSSLTKLDPLVADQLTAIGGLVTSPRAPRRNQ